MLRRGICGILLNWNPTERHFEPQEAESRDVLGRGYREHGGDPGNGYRYGNRFSQMNSAEGAVEYTAPQIAGRVRQSRPADRPAEWHGPDAHARDARSEEEAADGQGAARLSAANHRGRAHERERTPRRRLVRDKVADREMVHGRQDRVADQGPQAQPRRRPAQVPRLRRHNRNHCHVRRMLRAERARHAGADGHPQGRDPCPRRAHDEAEPPQAARPARPGPGDRGACGQHRAPGRIHPVEAPDHAGHSQAPGRTPGPSPITENFRTMARRRQPRVHSVPLKDAGGSSGNFGKTHKGVIQFGTR